MNESYYHRCFGLSDLFCLQKDEMRVTVDVAHFQHEIPKTHVQQCSQPKTITEPNRSQALTFPKLTMFDMRTFGIVAVRSTHTLPACSINQYTCIILITAKIFKISVVKSQAIKIKEDTHHILIHELANAKRTSPTPCVNIKHLLHIYIANLKCIN